MTGQLDSKVVLVTGGGSGIGRAAALALAREGAKVALCCDNNVAGGKEVVAMITEAGGEALFVRTDITREAEVKNLVDQVVATYGRLDCAFNNAGVLGELGTTTECNETNWDCVVNINLKGVWLCLKYEIPAMIDVGGGTIVNAASTLGLVGARNYPAYVATKHGVVGLTRAAALEYAQAKVRVNAVCPGIIHTPMMEPFIAANPKWEAERIARHPIGRLGTPDDVAGAVVWLCSDAASFVTGMAMPVDGGYSTQ